MRQQQSHPGKHAVLRTTGAHAPSPYMRLGALHIRRCYTRVPIGKIPCSVRLFARQPLPLRLIVCDHRSEHDLLLRIAFPAHEADSACGCICTEGVISHNERAVTAVLVERCYPPLQHLAPRRNASRQSRHQYHCLSDLLLFLFTTRNKFLCFCRRSPLLLIIMTMRLETHANITVHLTNNIEV